MEQRRGHGFTAMYGGIRCQSFVQSPWVELVSCSGVSFTCSNQETLQAAGSFFDMRFHAPVIPQAHLRLHQRCLRSIGLIEGSSAAFHLRRKPRKGFRSMSDAPERRQDLEAVQAEARSRKRNSGTSRKKQLPDGKCFAAKQVVGFGLEHLPKHLGLKRTRPGSPVRSIFNLCFRKFPNLSRAVPQDKKGWPIPSPQAPAPGCSDWEA